MHFLAEYGIFLAKIATLVIAILIVLFAIVALGSKDKTKKEKIQIKSLNEKYQQLRETIGHEIFNKAERKKLEKAEKLSKESRKKIFVLNFHGDVKASQVKHLREEITAILLIAEPKDEVVVCVESYGGIVHAYGLAASQLQRLRQNNIQLTVSIDKVAASGGYLMACVANRIIAAPFAIIGSIGVVAQLPNFHNLLKKHNIQYELITAGEYKRTLTLFGENTEKGREKLQEEIEVVHNLFKRYIVENRPHINIDQVATGEHWCASEALGLKLVDRLTTSDDYLLKASKNADVYQLTYQTKRSLLDRLSSTVQMTVDKIFYTWQERNEQSRFL